MLTDHLVSMPVIVICFAVAAFRTMFAVVDMLVLTVGAMNMRPFPLRMAVGMRMDDLCLRKGFFVTGAFRKAQYPVGKRSDLVDIVRHHKDRYFFLNIDMVKDV